MNIIFDYKELNIENVFFLETKKNMLMDGNFTKLIYSNELVSINGIYLNFPIQIQSTNKLSNKKFVNFQIQNANNNNIIKELSSIEHNLLLYYKKLYNCNKNPYCILNDQLNCGNIKIYRELNFNIDNIKNNFIIKISGIWEDKNNFGIAYKFIEVNYI